MISTRVRRGWSVSFPAGSGGLGAEVLVQVALCGLAEVLAAVLTQTGASVDHAFTVLGSSMAIAAAILLALAAWLSADGSAVRIAFAVAVYGICLLVKAVGPEAADALVAGDLAMIGVALLCWPAMREVDLVNRAGRKSALTGAGVLVCCAIVSLVPPAALAPAIQSTIDVSAGAATAAVGLAMMWCGVRDRQPLLRPAGLALLTLAAQQSPAGSALGLAGIAMLLVTAVPFAVSALRAVWRDQADSQSRLRAAEQAMACTEVRDHEMRNLVAGLSGAVTVLTATGTAGDSPDRSHLGAAARVELERLRRILDSDQGGKLAPAGPPTVAVGPLLGDLAALHGDPDTPIEVTVTEEPHALVPPDCLAHIVTNLLVNCARHAPGARVRVTARCRAGSVVIEVSDDGPGLPQGMTAELLTPGVRGPSSTGTGLGLHVSAELASHYGGVIRLVPTPAGSRGCTVVVELPAAAADWCLLEHVAV